MNLTLPPIPDTIRPLLTPDAQHLRKLHPDIPLSPAHCITCNGKKSFLWYSHDREDPVTYDCSCNDQFILHRVLLNSGIPESYQRFDWEDLTSASETANIAITSYMDHVNGYIDAGMGLILSGSIGAGKSLIGYLILKDLIQKGVICHSTSFVGMIESFTSGWVSQEDKAWFNARVRHAKVLLIDDLGREHHKKSGAVGQTMVESVVRDRVGRNLPTFVTTNLPPDKIIEGYGSNTMSLLRERSRVVEVFGEDQRGAMADRVVREVEQGVRRPILL